MKLHQKDININPNKIKTISFADGFFIFIAVPDILRRIVGFL